MTACKFCDAPIEWAEWETSKKAIPLDPGPVPDGNLACVRGRVHYFTDQDEKLARERRRAHFATCPRASEARSR